MAEFAPGIKRNQYFGNIQKLKPGQLLDYVIQRHDATRRGTHRDFRIGNKHMGMYSWALNTAGLPQEGERVNAIRTNLHTHAYKDWEGVIPAGKYGAGRVAKQEEGKVLITNTSPKHFSFSIADRKHPERYSMVNPYEGRAWLLSKSKTPEHAGAEKRRYKSVSKEELEHKLKNLQPNEEVQAKLDGALNFLNIRDGKLEMLSHRTSKMTGKPVVQTERFFGRRPHVEIPKHLNNAVLLAEVLGEKDGKNISAAELSGLLNSTVENSLKTQKEKGIKLKGVLFDIDERGDKTYQERKELLKEYLKHLPKNKFTIAQGTNIPGDAKKLYKQISKGEHPDTKEGVVVHTPKEVLKWKAMPESDVHIHSFFPAEKGSKYDGNAVGGFRYSNEAGGPVVGRVGSGIDDAMRKLMHEHPEWFLHRIAKIKSQEKHQSGAHRAPVFLGLHEDKS
jgi:ATP-dependent DNA ligase